MEINQREEEGLPNQEEYENKILSQEQIFFTNKLQEVEDQIEELLESLEGEDVSDNQELAELQQSRDFFNNKLSVIEAENLFSSRTKYDKEVISRRF